MVGTLVLCMCKACLCVSFGDNEFVLQTFCGPLEASITGETRGDTLR